MKKTEKVSTKIFYDDKGKKVGVMLKVRDFTALMEQLEDLSDVLVVYKRTFGKKISGSPLEDVRKKLLGK